MVNNYPTNTSQYKLIVSDFDGTLAGADHITSPKTVQAVKKWTAGGRHFTIATGRQYLMIDDECRKMGIKDPVVVRGGAEVVNPVTDEIIYSELIEREDVEIILKELHKSNLFFIGIEVDDVIYNDSTLWIPFPKITFKKVKEFSIQSIPKLHVKPKDPNDHKADEFIEKMISKLPRVTSIATHNKQFGKGWDITSTKATKLHGIVHVLKSLGLKRENTIGVGDSYNDFPLLEAAGFKVAMGNAHQELKEIADLVVPSNEENGVAYLIDRLLK